MRIKQRKRIQIREDKRIVFYGRSGTADQGLAMRLQLAAANKWRRSQGIPEFRKKDIFFDVGYSGMNFARPALSRLIEYIKDGKVQKIFVLGIHKLSRDLRSSLTLVDIFNSHNVSLHSAEGQIDISSEGEELSFPMLGLFSEHFRAVLKEKQLAGMKRKKQLATGGKNK